MKLVIDTNRLAAALIKSSLNRELILVDKFEFYSPDYITTEIENNRSYFIKKAKINSNEFDDILNTLLDHIHLVPFEQFKDNYLKALKIMNTVDPNDSVFLALGLSIDVAGIWTEDKDFYAQNILRVYSTKELLRLLDKF